MLTDESIEVELPEGVATSEVDREVLKAACEAVMTLRYEQSAAFRDTLQRLEDQGWIVRWRLGWVASAKKGPHFEEATGRTLDEALRELAQLAQTDMVTGWS